jgi:hypothetical protein
MGVSFDGHGGLNTANRKKLHCRKINCRKLEHHSKANLFHLFEHGVRKMGVRFAGKSEENAGVRIEAVLFATGATFSDEPGLTR